MNLKKKVGPLPVWAWGLIFGVVGYYVYVRSRSTATTGISPTDAVLDPNAIDPNTGLTYGQEEGAALNATAGGAVGTTPADSNLVAGTNELGDLEAFLGQFGNIASQLGFTPPGTLAPPPEIPAVPATNISPATAAATAVPKSVAATKPNTTPRTNPAQTLLKREAADENAMAASKLAQSIKAQLGTSQGIKLNAGGSKILAQLKQQGFKATGGGGTYVKGNQKYFVFGKGTNQAIRKAQ